MASNQMISVRRSSANASEAWIRLLDVIVASAGLAVLFPLFLVISLAIVLDTGRPVLFFQTRLGQSGRHFRMFKFRKFYKDVGSDGLPLTMPDDSRLTLVGKFIDKTKLNELPQLWNVLLGDMSIVGPRPETLEFADCFVGRYQSVLDYKPGILGPSQVAFRHEASLFPQACDQEAYYRGVLFPTKADIDLRYYRTRSLASDLGWIVRGAIAVFCWNASASPALPAYREPSAAGEERRTGTTAARYVRRHSDGLTRAFPAVGRTRVIE